MEVLEDNALTRAIAEVPVLVAIAIVLVPIPIVSIPIVSETLTIALFLVFLVFLKRSKREGKGNDKRVVI